jgi:excisionase family DNA binding protein
MKTKLVGYELLTASDVARYCGVTSVTVSRWIRGDKLRAYTTPGGHYRIRKRDFKEFLSASGLPVDEQYFSSGAGLGRTDEQGQDSGQASTRGARVQTFKV